MLQEPDGMLHFLYVCYIYRNPWSGLEYVVNQINLKGATRKRDFVYIIELVFTLFYYCFSFSAKNLLSAKPLVGEYNPRQQPFPIRGQKTHFLLSQHFF